MTRSKNNNEANLANGQTITYTAPEANPADEINAEYHVSPSKKQPHHKDDQNQDNQDQVNQDEHNHEITYLNTPSVKDKEKEFNYDNTLDQVEAPQPVVNLEATEPAEKLLDETAPENQFDNPSQKKKKEIQVNDSNYLGNVIPTPAELELEFANKMKELSQCTIQDKMHVYHQDVKDYANQIFVELQKSKTDRVKAIEILNVTIALVKATEKNENNTMALNEEHFALAERAAQLAQESAGCTCYVRISGGLLLMLAGVVLMAVSVAAAIFTKGFSMPITSIGLEIGKDYIIAGVVALTLAVATLGYFSASYGRTCMVNGFQHGLSQGLANLSAFFKPHAAQFVKPQQETALAEGESNTVSTNPEISDLDKKQEVNEQKGVENVNQNADAPQVPQVDPNAVKEEIVENAEAQNNFRP